MAAKKKAPPLPYTKRELKIAETAYEMGYYRGQGVALDLAEKSYNTPPTARFVRSEALYLLENQFDYEIPPQETK